MAVLLVMNSLCSFGCSKSGSGTGGAVTVPDTTPVTTDTVFPRAELWLTTADRSVLFQRQSGVLGFSTSPGQGSTITVDSTQSYQSIDGFGYCLTGGSAYLIHQLADQPREMLLHELFDVDSTAIGVSYLRITIGASDLSRKVFSYDDMPAGETDTTLSRFNLGPDTADLIPLL